MIDILPHLPVVILALGVLVIGGLALRSSRGPKPVVFLSSTSEFETISPKLVTWIRELGDYDPWWYKQNDATEEIIEKTISLSRFFVLLLGHTFGANWRKSDRSIVQREFELALENIPIHAVRAFVRNPPAGPIDPRQQRFIKSIRDYGTKIRSREWSSDEKLYKRVVEALSRAQETYQKLHVERARRLNRFIFLPMLVVTGALSAGSYYGVGGTFASQPITFGVFGVVALATAGFNIFHSQEH